MLGFSYWGYKSPLFYENSRILLFTVSLNHNMAQQAEQSAVGKVSFASGEEITYTNPEEYLKAIREKLP